MNNKPEPTTYCASENCNPTSAEVLEQRGQEEISSGFGTLKASKAAATIGLAISVGAASVLMDSNKEAMAAEAISSGQNTTELSKKNKGIIYSVTSAKLTVKSSAEQVNPENNNAPALIHKIKAGETLVSIAKEYDLSPDSVAAYNNLSPDKELTAGQMLKIPVEQSQQRDSQTSSSKSIPPQLKNLRSKQIGLQKSLAKLALQQKDEKESVQGKVIYKVQQGDTLGEIASRHGVSITQLIRENKITDPDEIAVDLELVITPAQQTKQNANANRYVSRRRDSVRENTDRTREEPNKRSEDLTNDTPVNPYVAKLRADIQKLQQDYKPSDSADTTEVKTDNNETRSQQSMSVSERLSSRDWLKERLRSRSESQTNRSLPPVSSLRSSSQSSLSRSKPQLISSLNTETKNSSTSLGVSPQLPALSTADEYLPNTYQSRVSRVNGYIWPTNSGTITSGYGWRWGRLHKGVDIAGPVGTPILAAAPGQVIYAGWNSGGYGNLVKLRHYDGSITLYAHNSSILVRRGQTVGAGQMIARMGSTGYSTGPHLHFEIHKGRGAVNPMAYLPRRRR